MDAVELIHQLEARGAEMRILGDRLRVQPRSAVPEDLIEEIRKHKPEIMELLRSGGWPTECLESERRFGQPHARLFPLLGRRVATPKGRGRLLQVFASRAAVRLEHAPDILTFLLPEEVRPPGLGGSTADWLPREIH
jgi:TubC N-terminal docking domain